MLDKEGFLLQHFAGPVIYTTAEFIEKNNDALHYSLEELLYSSENKLVHKMHNVSLKFDLRDFARELVT